MLKISGRSVIVQTCRPPDGAVCRSREWVSRELSLRTQEDLAKCRSGGTQQLERTL